MIIREWRGRAAREKAEEYPRHFRNVVVPELKGVIGFCGAHLSVCSHDEGLEFVVLTRWTSMEAIRNFAGDRPERAVVEPGAIAALTGFDFEVRHYEVLEDIGTPQR